MKIRSIRLENVRRFVEPAVIEGIGDGVNVLTAPNERGKSTFFDALHAVFFKDRKSWDREIRGLVPYAGGDPSVTVEIELPKGVFRIEKSWNSRRNGDARITSAGRLIKQADDAEAWIADTLKSPKDGGPAGLLWVRQGQSGLDEGDTTNRARRDLLTSVAGEVEAMTGGRRMDTARDMCRNALDRYLTKTGRAKADGPLKRMADNVSALREEREGLERKSNDLRRELGVCAVGRLAPRKTGDVLPKVQPGIPDGISGNGRFQIPASARFSIVRVRVLSRFPGINPPVAFASA